MAGDGDCHGAVAEADLVAVRELAVDPRPSLSDLYETSGTYEISVAKQGETGPLRQ